MCFLKSENYVHTASISLLPWDIELMLLESSKMLLRPDVQSPSVVRIRKDNPDNMRATTVCFAFHSAGI